MTRLDLFRNKVVWLLWLGLILCLPVTSLPFFAKILRTSSVAPASGLFLIIIAVLWIPFFVFQKGRTPFQIKPLAIFFLVALISICLAFFREIPDYNQSLILTSLEGAATLGLGALFYFVSSNLPNSLEKVQKTLAAVNWGGFALIIWSLIQIIVSFATNDFPEWMRVIQRQFSTTVLFDQRATGFAAEPSWLAHQLNLVYLAYWISASWNKTSAHQFRIWKLSFENVLLFFGVIVLFTTFSRGGLAAFVLVATFLFIKLNIDFGRWLVSKWKVKKPHAISALIAIGMVCMYPFK
jgi:uncharacterized membrane protein YjfL (UPF0719 family)